MIYWQNRAFAQAWAVRWASTEVNVHYKICFATRRMTQGIAGLSTVPLSRVPLRLDDYASSPAVWLDAVSLG
jgi:hypothetical protein